VQRPPGLPCALTFLGGQTISTTRAQRAARTRRCPLDAHLDAHRAARICACDIRDPASKAVPDIAALIHATVAQRSERGHAGALEAALSGRSSAPAAPSPAGAAATAATAPAAAPATTSAATAATTAASTPGELLQVAFLQVASILPVEEMEGGEADIGHLLVAQHEALIGRRVLGLRNISSRRCGCSAPRQ